MHLTLLERLEHDAALAAGTAVQVAASAALRIRQAPADPPPMVYNQSALALSYGFVDYFDDRSFGGPNWDKPTNMNPSKLGSSSQLATATPFVVTVGIAALMLRFFSRTRFGARVWWDDLFAVMAGILLIATQLIFTRIVYLGRATLDNMLQTTAQFEEERLERITVGLKLYMAFELMYIFSSFFIKYSFLFLYLRISKETKKIKWFLRAAFVITTLAFVFCVLALFLTCTTLSDFWNIRNAQPSCEKKILLTFGTGISNIVTDTMVLAILIPLLLRASLSKAQIRGVCCLYGCGALVIVASGLRFATQLMHVSMLQSMGWSLLEVSLALILLCAPMVAKLLGAPLVQDRCGVIVRRGNNYDRRYSSSPFDKNLPAPPPMMAGVNYGNQVHVSRLGMNSQDTLSFARNELYSREVSIGGPPAIEEDSPTYAHIQERVSITTGTESTYGLPSRSPTVATSRSHPLVGLSPPPPPLPLNWSPRR
ncbi:hypothetical protein ABW20_dc0105964 [Dactylellina cionopaga]|nr:hypothetical protein ABW20_dc0105964 [Dactylellina cionopaga]